MFNKNCNKDTAAWCRILFICFAAIASIVSGTRLAGAQTPSPTPTDRPDVLWGGYKVTSTSELGYRWSGVDGNLNKYQSDLNYKKGFRSFDTNLLLESDTGKGKYFDSLLISNSGWGADPTGFTRINMEKIGFYKFNGNIRRVTYFNNLSNHALGEHTQNTTHNFGDFDVTFLPQDEKLRFNFGASLSESKGPGFTTTRAYGDEFPVNAFTRNTTDDYRVGVEGLLLGFNLGVTEGLRIFKDRSTYSLTAPNVGNNTTNTTALATFSRIFPTFGDTHYTQFNAHRTFDKKLDLTGRLIYSNTGSQMDMNEMITGRDNANNIVDLDQFNITSRSKRTQTRGDIGVTYMASEKLRISDSFTFDKFAVNGGENFYEALNRRNAAGNPLALVTTVSAGYRVNNYRRYVNTAEADYQVNNRVGFHIGYRYTNRRVIVTGYDSTYTSPISATNPALINEGESNSTNALIAGMKVKPMKNWVVFWDVEHGTADNVFTRIENYKYTNFRVRSRVTLNKFGLNLTAITKNNNNPSFTLTTPTSVDFTTNIRNRIFSGSADWSPIPELTVSSGYTYRYLTSYTPVILPINGAQVLGFSEFYVRDHYGYFDVAAKPLKRVSLYATYRIDRDKGQGNRFSTVTQNIITSYPMQFVTPEFRVAIQLTRNIDWNIGYQYFNYKDSQTPTLNYRARLPFTSVRIYFGNKAEDR